MEDTLVEIIKELEEFKNLGKKLGYDLDEEKLRNTGIKKLRKFYQENSLVCKVAEEKGSSYVKLIKLIEEKYNSFWKKIWAPKIDETFDKEVRKVIKSMNNVGIEYINPENFTTDGRRRNNKSHLLISGGVGLFTAALPKLIEWGSTTGYNVPRNSFVPIITVGAVYIGCKLKEYFYTNLEYLQESAKKTDKFLTNEVLTQHYLKLLSS